MAEHKKDGLAPTRIVVVAIAFATILAACALIGYAFGRIDIGFGVALIIIAAIAALKG
jgi:hypothetical protein